MTCTARVSRRCTGHSHVNIAGRRGVCEWCARELTDRPRARRKRKPTAGQVAYKQRVAAGYREAGS